MPKTKWQTPVLNDLIPSEPQFSFVNHPKELGISVATRAAFNEAYYVTWKCMRLDLMHCNFFLSQTVMSQPGFLATPLEAAVIYPNASQISRADPFIRLFSEEKSEIIKMAIIQADIVGELNKIIVWHWEPKSELQHQPQPPLFI